MEKQGAKKSLFTSPFLEKTYHLLENPELEHIICWNQDGTMILINSIEDLANILPKYFKHRKIESFIRQLNIYDFKKVKKHIAFNAFKHPCFLRDDLSKLHLIKRRVKSGKSEKTIASSPKLEGNISRQNTEGASEKTSEFGQNEEKLFRAVERLGSGEYQGSGELEEGFDYLYHDVMMPINHGYYDWEDVFA